MNNPLGESANNSDPEAFYKNACELYASKNYKELERLFAKYLKKSYDLRFWNLYVEYVKKVSTKKVNLCDVYAFVWSHFEHSYESYSIATEYLNELMGKEEDSLSEEKIRKAFQRALSTPMQNMGLMWSNYEKWEVSVNRAGARAHTDALQSAYQNASATFNRLNPHIEKNNIFGILDIETENPLKLSPKDFEARLLFIFNFYIFKRPSDESLYLLRTFYLKEGASIPIESDVIAGSPLLSVWLSFVKNTNLFNFDDPKNFELTVINYFNWLIKFEGISSFRAKFTEIKDRAGVHIYLYSALAEYYQGKSKENAYQIFTEAATKFPNDPLISENFLGLYLKMGDTETARILFKKLAKSSKMWEDMVEYEYLYGDFETYKGLLKEKTAAMESGEFIKPGPVAIRRSSRASGSKAIFETAMESLNFMDLTFSTSDVCSEFIAKLPELSKKENFMLNIDTNKVMELLLSVTI
ncbi:cleavage stimulation factor subunit 3 [Enteropsectra breve]|nr:cleavage stimulation factor subunit 3 [Enteropsectra breve]